VPAPPSPVRPCDRAWWLQPTTRRAWLASNAPPAHHVERRALAADAPFDHAPLAVLDTALGDAWLADLHGPAIVARWAPVSALARAITSDVLVSPEPGTPGDDALRLLPGLRVAGDGAWLEVGEVEGIQLRGWIPAASTGPIWDEPAPVALQTVALPAPLELHRAPTAASPIAAVLAAGVPVTAHPEGTWQLVTAIAPHAIATGYARDAPMIDMALPAAPAPIAATSPAYGPGTCLYDAPGGDAVGVVRGRLDAAPMPTDEPGWFAVELATAFGDQRLFTDRAPRPRVDVD